MAKKSASFSRAVSRVRGDAGRMQWKGRGVEVRGGGAEDIVCVCVCALEKGLGSGVE
jgi:hypothetical protein